MFDWWVFSFTKVFPLVNFVYKFLAAEFVPYRALRFAVNCLEFLAPFACYLIDVKYDDLSITWEFVTLLFAPEVVLFGLSCFFIDLLLKLGKSFKKF